MITYAERICFRRLHLEILHRVEVFVARVSHAWGNELRCHELARAVQHVINETVDPVQLVLVDGKCGPVEHSWLVFSDGVMLDPYVPGRLPAVQLVDPLVGTAYRPGELRIDIQHAIVERIVREMRGDAS